MLRFAMLTVTVIAVAGGGVILAGRSSADSAEATAQASPAVSQWTGYFAADDGWSVSWDEAAWDGSSVTYDDLYITLLEVVFDDRGSDEGGYERLEIRLTTSDADTADECIENRLSDEDAGAEIESGVIRDSTWHLYETAETAWVSPAFVSCVEVSPGLIVEAYGGYYLYDPSISRWKECWVEDRAMILATLGTLVVPDDVDTPTVSSGLFRVRASQLAGLTDRAGQPQQEGRTNVQYH